LGSLNVFAVLRMHQPMPILSEGPLPKFVLRGGKKF
jgi:hypothetical protein